MPDMLLRVSMWMGPLLCRARNQSTLVEHTSDTHNELLRLMRTCYCCLLVTSWVSGCFLITSGWFLPGSLPLPLTLLLTPHTPQSLTYNHVPLGRRR